METANNKPEKRRYFKRIFLWMLGILLLIIAISGIYLYNNFNRLLSDALIKSFNANIASDIYELKFSDLIVNPVSGNIRIKNVAILPREKHLNDYPYINSKLSLKTNELVLNNVDLLSLIRENKLKLGKIVIAKPELQVEIDDKMPVFLPFKEAVSDTAVKSTVKRNIESFSLKIFDLKEASLQLQNHAKGRYLELKDLNITLRDLLIDQKPGIDRMKYSAFAFNIGGISGHLKRDSISFIRLSDYGITIDSMEIEKTLDTFIYKYSDFNLGFRDLMMIPGDSSYHFSVKTFSVGYSDSSVNFEKVSFVPSLSEKEVQKQFKYQHNTSFSGEVGRLSVQGFCFDSLFLAKKIFIRKIEIDSASIKLFKDKTKPVDKKHKPDYLGQSVRKIPLPVIIQNIVATNVNLVSKEIKPDNTPAEVQISSGEANITNITNQSVDKPLGIKATAFLGGKVKFEAGINFSYKKYEFDFNGTFNKFRFNDLNGIIQSYAPVSISDGFADAIRFNGKATQKKAEGTMEFLYHDLKMNIQLKEKASWKNSVLSFAANTVVASSNPVSQNLPPKVVTYKIDRDVNKAFVNVLIKSALAGLKETVIMSKENKKAYREAKKKEKK